MKNDYQDKEKFKLVEEKL